jgi:hypothetical protein
MRRPAAAAVLEELGVGSSAILDRLRGGRAGKGDGRRSGELPRFDEAGLVLCGGEGLEIGVRVWAASKKLLEPTDGLQ